MAHPTIVIVEATATTRPADTVAKCCSAQSAMATSRALLPAEPTVKMVGASVRIKLTDTRTRAMDMTVTTSIWTSTNTTSAKDFAAATTTVTTAAHNMEVTATERRAFSEQSWKEF